MDARSIDTEFYLAPGGPVDRLQQRLWEKRNRQPRLGLRAAATALACWLPLAVLNALDPTPGADVSFWNDIAVQVRFLLIIPLLILAEGSVGSRSRLVVSQFLTSGLVGDADADRFEAAVRRGRRLLDSSAVEALLMAVSVGLVWIGFHSVIVEPSVFWFERPADGHTLSYAGWWYAFVATPVFVFLGVRWMWRCLVWWWFLGRVARFDLHLTGTHPDRMGGLGFVAFHQSVFAIFSFAASCAVSAAAASRILLAGATLPEYKGVLLAIIAGTTIVGIVPMLVFTPRLVMAKRRFWMNYSRFASDYVWMFEKKWMEKKTPDEEALGSGDIQSLADLGGSFERLVQMKPAVIDRRLVLAFLGAAVAPVLPLLLTMMPLRDIVRMLLKALM